MPRSPKDIVQKVDQVIRTDRLVVVVSVDAIIMDGDQTRDLCFEPDTLKFLVEVEKRADAGDLPWLLQHGKVYQLLPTSKAG